MGLSYKSKIHDCHSHESGNLFVYALWIPVFTVMTDKPLLMRLPLSIFVNYY